MKIIVRAIITVLLFGLILYVSGTNYIKFGNDVDFKNPTEVFEVGELIPEVNKPEVDVPIIETPEIEIEKPEIVVEQKEEPKEQEVVEQEVITEEKSDNLTLEELNSLISTIKVEEPNTEVEYNREDYEKPTKKYTYENEKLTRNKYAWHISEWLIKNDETGFEYVDPYTNLIITDTKKIDYDHIIPLLYAHQHGASEWDNEKKNKFSYDLMVGVDVSASENRSKQAKGPSEYLPKANKEDYCYTFFTIASEYGLSMTKRDLNVCKLEIMNSISENEKVELINKTILDKEE